jgi:hypothetical protein
VISLCILTFCYGLEVYVTIDGVLDYWIY